jgi:thioredoxin 1
MVYRGRTMSDIRLLQDGDFSEEALKDVNRMAVLFESPWCQGCHSVEAIIKELIAEETLECIWGKVDVSIQQGLAQRFGILSLPTLLVFRNGRIEDRMVGRISKEKLRSAIK